METYPGYAKDQVRAVPRLATRNPAHGQRRFLLLGYTGFLAAGLVVILLLLFAGYGLILAAEPYPGYRAGSGVSWPITRYLARGQQVQFCALSWSGPPITVKTTCSILNNQTLAHSFPVPQFSAGDLFLVRFSAEALNLSELIADWGVPTLVRRGAGGVSLVWDNPESALEGRMTWGDPHRIPPTVTLSLTVVR